jgi:hypothetical protein
MPLKFQRVKRAGLRYRDKRHLEADSKPGVRGRVWKNRVARERPDGESSEPNLLPATWGWQGHLHSRSHNPGNSGRYRGPWHYWAITRGKTAPLGYQERIGRNAERGVVMKPKPVAAFMIALFRANNAVSPDPADASPRCALRRTSRSPWPMRDWWRCT